MLRDRGLAQHGLKVDLIHRLKAKLLEPGFLTKCGRVQWAGSTEQEAECISAGTSSRRGLDEEKHCYLLAQCTCSLQQLPSNEPSNTIN